ncbi:MAG: zf-HC2 domain-containing protein [Vicinamibacteria bacterium]
MLSAYLDGKLDPVFHPSIEDHISRCEECYFVVRETAVLWSGVELTEPPAISAHAPGAVATDGVKPIGPGEVPLAPLTPVVAPIATSTREVVQRRKSFVARYVLPMAAMFVVGLGSGALWRRANLADSYEVAVKPLVEAVGERRFFEPRLTGGFKYGPSLSVKRSGVSGSDYEAWGVLAVAGEMRSRAAASIGERASAAAAALFTGDVDGAVTSYSQLVRDEPASAAWSSDLAAALLVRAYRGGGGADPRNDDALKALESSDRALQLDPRLIEARFNRGLALEMLGRADESRTTFAEIEAQGGAWSAAARDHLRNAASSVAPSR